MANKKALVVGINNYPPPNRLPSCVNDANAFKDILVTHYDFAEGDIQTLFDNQATVNNFQDRLQRMLAGASADDRFVVYYSGHGYSYAPQGVVKQYIVLLDDNGQGAFYAGSDLAALTQALPPGVLTVVLDSCFSGGMNKPYFVTTQVGGDFHRALNKNWTPMAETQMDKSFEQPLTGYEPFGCSPIDMRSSGNSGSQIFLLQDLVLDPAAKKAFSSVAPLSNVGQLLLDGLLVAACKDNETAAASNPMTNGLSAFTYCLQQELAAEGGDPITANLIGAVSSRLASLGFVQTPVIKAPPNASGLDQLSFVILTGGGTGPAVSPDAADLLRNLLAALAGQVGSKDFEPGMPVNRLTAYYSTPHIPAPSPDPVPEVGDLIRILYRAKTAVSP